MLEIIYCANGNKRFAEIAVAHGFLYGAQLPGTIYEDVSPLHFADQNWKDPQRDVYIDLLKKHRPNVATVLDWEQDEQLPEVLAWAEEAAVYVDTVIIIPKVMGGIAKLPRTVGGKSVRLGYSVPTRHGGTSLPAWEFSGWPIHLLGGSPHKQMRLAHYFDVVSADGNMILGQATRFCQFWANGNAKYAINRWWPTLREANDGVRWGDGSASADAPYEAFRRSCENVMQAWREYEVCNK